MTLVPYGVNVYAGPTKGTPPLQVDSEIVAIIGAFPCDDGTGYEIGKPEQWYACTSWEDFQNQYGDTAVWGEGNLNRSDGWNAYKTVQRIMYGYGIYPTLIYNVLDPSTNVTSVVDESQTYVSGTDYVTLDEKYILMSTIVVTDDPFTTTYVLGTDYTLERNSDGLVEVTRIATGGIGATDSVLIDYDYCDPSSITMAQVTAAIQGVNNIITSLGFAYLPGWLTVPDWSRKDYNLVLHETVRTDMLAMSDNMNSVFMLRFVYDLDETTFASTGDLQDLYDEKTILSEYGRACAGEGTFGNETEQLLSDWYIAMMSDEVQANGYPGVSPSNRVMTGFEPTNELSFPTQSNAVRDQGIICTILDTADRGWNLWGTWTSYYAGTATDLALDSTNQNDVIVYLNKSIVRDLWVKAQDRNFNSYTITAYVDSMNTLGKQLVSRGQMIGFEMEFLEEDNPDPSSQITLRLYILAPEPQKRTDVIIQVDLNYFNTLFPS